MDIKINKLAPHYYYVALFLAVAYCSHPLVIVVTSAQSVARGPGFEVYNNATCDNYYYPAQQRTMFLCYKIDASGRAGRTHD